MVARRKDSSAEAGVTAPGRAAKPVDVPRDAILQGDALARLRELPDGCVQCCVTSPPYFGLRDYGVPGQLGLEDTPNAYVARLVEVLREVRRVLRDDGTLWLNLGDSYATGIKGSDGDPAKGKQQGGSLRMQHFEPRRIFPGAAPKNLLMMPARVALALQADGWWLRADIIWAKGNVMPESVRDRPTRSYEHLFLLAKSTRYHYDAEAVREPCVTGRRLMRNRRRDIQDDQGTKFVRTFQYGDRVFANNPAGRNRRDVWHINPQPFRGAHFAVMPPALVEPCILAGTSPRACESCGSPWRREVERHGYDGAGRAAGNVYEAMAHRSPQSARRGPKANFGVPTIEERGWAPTCRCTENTGAGRCLVFDPFGGAGTVGMVAKRHGRDYLLIELNPAYCGMARARIAEDAAPKPPKGRAKRAKPTPAAPETPRTPRQRRRPEPIPCSPNPPPPESPVLWPAVLYPAP